MEINAITGKIIDTAFKLHSALGPGLLENVYEKCLEMDLREAGLEVESQVGVPLKYKNFAFDIGYRLDLLVEKTVIIEVKSVEILAPVHYSQLITYLKLYNKPVGLLMNFNSKYLKDGLHRLVNNFKE
ncbi:GxxExxY protein [Oceanihabitans sediminis]|uniref:GxxExxY protein n=1 Tax=Oceanihabitans sediminis TaxID=1812012 RepID=UPI00299E9DA9|nr:GxxExxY protein [Oceanihabitans sediminis]MDX1774838.1 GxxExxY protein [Oceanihabitans sediminis]